MNLAFTTVHLRLSLSQRAPPRGRRSHFRVGCDSTNTSTYGGIVGAQSVQKVEKKEGEERGQGDPDLNVEEEKRGCQHPWWEWAKRADGGEGAQDRPHIDHNPQRKDRGERDRRR